MQYFVIITSILAGLILLAAALTVLFGFFLTSAVIQPPRRTHQTALDYHIKYNGVAPDFYNSLKRIPFQLTSVTGNKLMGEWIDSSSGRQDKIVILVHGHGHNMMGSLKFIPLFQKRDFKILIYDQIHNGNSEGRYTTMGYYESEDLKRIIDSIYEQQGKPEILGLLGESMGAATVLMTACKDNRPDFVIADCPYADLEEQLEYRLKYAYGLGRFPLVPVGSQISRLLAGFRWNQVSPVREIENQNGLSSIPVLFAHGLNDTYIPPSSSEKLYSAKQGYRDLILIKGARHTESVCTDEATYDEAIARLLEFVTTQ